MSINVVDLKKSFVFYESFLKLERLTMVDMGDHRLYYYALPDEVRLELIEYDEKTKIISCAPNSRGNYRHIAFGVADIDEMFRRCKDFGIMIRLLPEHNEKLKAKIMLIEDPNGVEIELVEKDY